MGFLHHSVKQMMKNIIWVIPAMVALSGIAAAQKQTTTFYVATDGNDAGQGTASDPFQTLAKARLAVEDALQAGLRNVTVVLRGGTYRLDEPLVFGTADSPSTGGQVTWESAPGEKAIISGGVEVPASAWHKCVTNDDVCAGGKNNVWQASLSGSEYPDDFREVYVNDQHATKARGPIHELGPVDATGYKPHPAPWTVNWQNGQLVISDGVDRSHWSNISDMEFSWSAAWNQSYCGVASISSTAPYTLTIMNPCGADLNSYTFPFWPWWGTTGNANVTAPTWLANAKELLPVCDTGTPVKSKYPPGQRGCWYLDKLAHFLYYTPTTPDMAGSTVYVPKLEHLIQFVHAANIKFSRLTFSYSTWLEPNEPTGHVALQGGYTCLTGSPNDVNGCDLDHGSPLGAAIVGRGNNIEFSHNLFTHLAARAVLARSGSRDWTFYANVFRDNGAGSIQYGENDDRDATGNDQTAHLVFKDNLVEAPFQYPGGGPFQPYGIEAFIDHNEIDGDQAVAAINVAWGWWPKNGPGINYARDNVISNNKIVNACNWYLDCGAIYTNGGQYGTVVVGNYVDGVIHGKGGCFYTDDGSQDITIENNVCVNPFSNFFLAPWKSVQRIQVRNNWTTTLKYESSGQVTMSNNSLFNAASPPAQVTAIINNAGIEHDVTPGP